MYFEVESSSDRAEHRFLMLQEKFLNSQDKIFIGLSTYSLTYGKEVNYSEHSRFTPKVEAQ